MVEGSTTTAIDEARRMLGIFASVDARAVDVTWTNSEGKPRRPRSLSRELRSLGGPLPVPKNPDWLNSVFIEAITLDDLACTMPAMLATAKADRLNLIVRPDGPDDMTFLQLDDLKTAKHQITTSPLGGLAFGSKQMLDLASVSFAIIETSPGSFQAWLALPRVDKEFARRVKKAIGADTGASGAVRIPGSLNFKPEYAPDYPRVQIREARPGRKTSALELEQLGLVAAPEVYAPLPPRRFMRRDGDWWPSYGKALARAPMNSEGDDRDRSRADFVWCMIAIDRGRHSISTTASQLLQVKGSKAWQLLSEPNGQRTAYAYALLTATKASEAVDRRRPEQQRVSDHRHG
jgi:hypothetical protein